MKEAKAGTNLRVRCLCGIEAAVSPRSMGRVLPCKTCGGTSVIVWGIDAKSKKATPIALEKSTASPRGFKLPMGLQDLACPCGVHLFARPREAGKRVECPACATWLKLEQSRDPQTLETRIRVVKSRLNQLPSVPSPTEGAAEPAEQSILCSCGESLGLDRAEPGQQVQCPACGTLIRLEITKDPETSRTVVAPRVIGKPAPPERRGIDEDLSLDDFR